MIGAQILYRPVALTSGPGVIAREQQTVLLSCRASGSPLYLAAF
jgi:hypothetical protein